MSNVKELTEYFLTDKYEKEINETNALGTKGKLVRKYAAFLKHLWFGTSSTYSPWALKQGISEFQSMVYFFSKSIFNSTFNSFQDINNMIHKNYWHF